MKVPVTAIKTDALYFKEEGFLSVVLFRFW